MVKLKRVNEAQLDLFNKPLPLGLRPALNTSLNNQVNNQSNSTLDDTPVMQEEPVNADRVYSREYAQRYRELKDLNGDALFEALREGDILWGSWGYNRTITDWFIVKRKTAKRLILHLLVSKNGNLPGDSVGGWTTCPMMPPKESQGERDVQGMMMLGSRYSTVKIPIEPKYLRVWDGTYGWENDD